MKITINNEEVLCNKDFTINEEMLNTSSVILNNVYPKTWEQDKDYVSRFYYPKDYSKCKIFDEIVHPEEKEVVEGTSFSINVDTTKQYQVQTLKGQTSQSGTPTPTSPQPINITTGRQVVSVCGKNLFDIDNATIKQNYGKNADGNEVSSPGGNYTTSYTPVKPNTTYTFSSILSSVVSRIYFYDKNKNWITRSDNIKNNTNKFTFTTQSNCYYIQFQNVVNFAEDNKVQLELGNQATTYEEYKGNDYEINLGKNLANPTNINMEKSINDSGNMYTANTRASLYKNPVNPNTQYSLSCASGYQMGNIFQYDSSGTYISTVSSSYAKEKQYTSNSNTYYISFVLKNDNNTVIDVSEKDNLHIQIEKGSLTEYSPYKTPIYLGKIGTYQDYIFRNTQDNPLYDSTLEEGQWYIHKEIGRVVLNGSESGWAIRITGNGYQDFRITISDIALLNQTTLGYLDNRFRITDASNWDAYDEHLVQMNDKRLSFRIKETRLSAITVEGWKTWLASNNVVVYYVLNTPTNTLIEDEELINQLNSIELLEGLNNVSVSSPYLPFVMSLMYNYQEGYTEEELYFCGIVKNTGEISLNPRHPHYCNIQVLDFKDFLSQGETLDFVITEKTIGEAIDQVIGTIAPYGFIKGNILLDDVDELMGTYSTKDKTAYDVFNYIADITQSRWTTRMVDENTIAIDYFDPNKLPLGEQIEYNQTWFRNHKIDDLSYSYSSNDYRNKQVMLSGEVYSNIETTEILVADGYQTQFNTIDKIGKVSSLLLNGTPVSIITKEEYDLGYDADFYYQPGNKYFESVNLVSTGAILTIVYYAIIEGREVILNQDEISLIEERTGRKGVVARYENRNDATTTGELQAIGQSYLEYKGIPEIKLNVSSRENTWNIGDRVYFNAPLDELKQTYMVKAKKVQRITTIDELFYQYELTSSFNMEQDINYFDNQRYKSRGNIGEGEFISRNIDIENTANVIFYDLEVQEVEVEGNSTLQSELQSVLGGVE